MEATAICQRRPGYTKNKGLYNESVDEKDDRE